MFVTRRVRPRCRRSAIGVRRGRLGAVFCDGGLRATPIFVADKDVLISRGVGPLCEGTFFACRSCRRGSVRTGRDDGPRPISVSRHGTAVSLRICRRGKHAVAASCDRGGLSRRRYGGLRSRPVAVASKGVFSPFRIGPSCGSLCILRACLERLRLTLTIRDAMRSRAVLIACEGVTITGWIGPGGGCASGSPCGRGRGPASAGRDSRLCTRSFSVACQRIPVACWIRPTCAGHAGIPAANRGRLECSTRAANRFNARAVALARERVCVSF